MKWHKAKAAWQLPDALKAEYNMLLQDISRDPEDAAWYKAQQPELLEGAAASARVEHVLAARNRADDAAPEYLTTRACETPSMAEWRMQRATQATW